ncbi:hypothetical protein [Streptomyces sp. JW3]|uniref:hypothetical protein n=1 Tax=Streptomyces sp. JW3 TaxID=3456955 RepID=UPI003FA4958E
MIEVQAVAGSMELHGRDQYLFRVIVREIREAWYLLEGDDAWPQFLELRSAVREERKLPDMRIEISADQMKWLGEFAYRTCEHLGDDEFHSRAGADLWEARELLHRLTGRTG